MPEEKLATTFGKKINKLKFMKKLFTQTFIALLFLTFLGCSSDDSEKTHTDETPTAKTSIKINKVTVTAMSFKDTHGAAWDETNGPDVEIRIRDAENLNHLKGPSVHNDVTPSQMPLVWENTTLVLPVSSMFFIELMDNDGMYGDPMGPVYFVVSDYTSGPNAYPKTITVTRTTLGTLTTTIKLDVTWE